MSAARLVLVLVVLAVIGLGLAGMARGTRTRASRQRGLPAPPAVPASVDDLEVRCGPVAGRYLASTTAGDWLDRVVVHGLGNRSRAELTVTSAGILINRTGEPQVWIPVADLRGVRLDRGIAQQVFEAGGVLVLTWRCGPAQDPDAGEVLLDTGFRADSTADHVAVATAAHQLLQLAGGTR